MLLLINGRIMGASGILGGVIDGSGRANLAERLTFIAGLIGAPALIAYFGSAPSTNVTNNLVILIIGGLAVGVGTRMANGCTSGHGVCGISRFSLRGIVATLIYFAVRRLGDAGAAPRIGGDMMRLLFSLMSGAIFGLGLMISGMTNTDKVQGWLDVFGAWDPTLAFVLGGAIPTNGFRLATDQPALDISARDAHSSPV